jgi:hypothetical protein
MYIFLQDKVLNPKTVMTDDNQHRRRSTTPVMYARSKNQTWVNLLPTTKAIAELLGFAKGGGPNFYQQYNQSGDVMGWTKLLWEATTYSMVSLQVSLITLRLSVALLFETIGAGECKGKNRCFRTYYSRGQALRSKLSSGGGHCLHFAYFHWRKLLCHSPRSLWQSSSMWQDGNCGHEVFLSSLFPLLDVTF